jgi:hypothetical protein
MLSSPVLAKVTLLQQSFCPSEHSFEGFSVFTFSSHGSAFPYTATSTKLSQQKCMSAAKAVLEKSTAPVRIMDNILWK